MAQIKQVKADAQPRPNIVVEHPKRNRFYALKRREEQEMSTDVDNGNFLVFSFPVYALLYPGSTLPFVTPLVSNKFDLLPEILPEPFLVSNPLGDNVRAEGVCTEVDGIEASPFEIKLGVIKFKS